MSERILQNIQELLNNNRVDWHSIVGNDEQSLLESVLTNGYSEEQIIKSLLLKTGFGFKLAVMPLNERFDSKKFKKFVGSQSLRFASQEELANLMDCEPGVCHPFGMLANIETIADESISTQNSIVFSAGVPLRSIAMNFADYVRIASPTVAHITN